VSKYIAWKFDQEKNLCFIITFMQVIVRDDDEGRTFSGTYLYGNVPLDVIFSDFSNQIQISFHSDFSVIQKGFLASFQIAGKIFCIKNS